MTALAWLLPTALALGDLGLAAFPGRCGPVSSKISKELWTMNLRSKSPRKLMPV